MGWFDFNTIWHNSDENYKEYSNNLENEILELVDKLNKAEYVLKLEYLKIEPLAKYFEEKNETLL